MAVPNRIAKRALVRDEGPRHDGVALPKFVAYMAMFRDDLPTRDQRRLIA